MGEHKELEPCPWCGVVPALQWHTQEGEMGEGRYFYLVECGNGQCPMGLVSTGGPYRTAADAVKRWNSRVNDDWCWCSRVARDGNGALIHFAACAAARDLYSKLQGS